MSLLSRKELRVALCPDQAALLHVRRDLGLRGLGREAHGRRVVPCGGGGQASPWHAALRALETALQGAAGSKLAATVVLSNHFLRYTLVPWSASLTEAADEMAYVRHCFAKVYGAGAQQWTMRLSGESRGSPRLACAMDTVLLDGLRGVFDKAGVVLKSVQPHLMAVFNGIRGRLKGRNAWFALLEPGNLCLALLHQGRWVQIRNLRVGADWPEELAVILEREAYLSDAAPETRDVFLWTSGQPEAPLPLGKPWSIHVLTPRPDAGWSDAGRFAMALGA